MSEELATSQVKEAKIRPLVQVLFIFLSSCIIWFCLSKRISTFKTNDPKQPLIHITPETYNAFGGFPDIIKIGLHITQFRAFNIIANEFDFDGIIWFEFNPDTLSLQTLEKFIFKNGDVISKSLSDTQIINNQLLVRYNIRVKCNNQLNYASFPLDNHTLTFTVANYLISPSTALFASSVSEFIIKAQTESFGWEQVDHRVTTGIEKTEIDTHDENTTSHYPVAQFSIDYERYGTRYTLSILLPLLLIFYLTLFSFSCGEEGGLNLTIGGVTATLGYRFVIENFSPKVGYFMISDVLFFLFLGCTALIFVITIIDTYARRLTFREKMLLLLILHLFVIAVCVHLFLFKD
jgi:hypothetical protein